MKRIVYTWLLILVGLLGYGQQDQNLTVTDARVLPRPTTVGGTVNASFKFYAENGATLMEQSGEVIRYVVCFNRITAASIENATVETVYELSEGGTNNFVEWTYNEFSNCWIGITNRSLANASGFTVTFKNLTVARAATPADANNSVGIGFAVNLTPHSRDPSSGDTDDFTDNYTYTVQSSADLGVTKTASSLTPAIGSQVTFTVVATNNGPDNATGVVVNEAIPSGYTLISVTPNTGTWTAPNWTIGNLANGASATMTVVATVNATGSYANTVTVTGNEPDPDPTNNTDTETPAPTPAPAPSIALVKTGVLSTDGNTIIYTFTVRNTGNVVLNPVVVNDSKLTPSNVALLATILAPGAETTGTATYTVTAAEKAAGQVQNTATATGTPPTGTPVADVSGTDFTNNTPTVVPVPRADLSVTKVASNLSPRVGDNVTFTITATNNGPNNATGVVVNEAIPSGYTLVSATPNIGTWAAPNWTIGNLANGASATITVIATVNATGNYANTVTVTGNQPDPNPTNNTDTKTPTPIKCPEGVNCLTVKVTRR